MALVGDVLYEVRVDGSVGAYDIASEGELLWETDAEGNWAGGPIVSGGMVFLTNDSTGAMAFADPALIARLPKRAAKHLASRRPRRHPRPPESVHGRPGVLVARTRHRGARSAWTPGPDGLLYILDTKPQVTVIDPADGHVVRRWGRQGAGPGEFDVDACG